jgi:hypothetical protein
MDEDRVIHKAEFIAEFFCSPLAVEVYKEAAEEFKVDELHKFVDALWSIVESAIEEDKGSDDTDWA